MFDKKVFIKESLKESSEIKLKVLDNCYDDILKIGDVFVECIKRGNKLLFCGNGGSAADCQHLATEFMIRLSHDVKRPAIGAIALTTDSSNITAGGNDIGFENIFARNVEGIGSKGDILIGISTSGNSENIIRAMKKAKEKGIITVGLLGKTGGRMKSECDYSVCIPSENVQRIQESHITVGHILCEITEREIYK
ncbi:MAG: D-sedoheptulose 7-phosphate isomerase [Ignavibacteriae bacterium]|nr:D-sedoheptulose 7-phosphate isomerase [Ignavibacteriota bacterium]